MIQRMLRTLGTAVLAGVGARAGSDLYQVLRRRYGQESPEDRARRRSDLQAERDRIDRELAELDAHG